MFLSGNGECKLARMRYCIQLTRRNITVTFGVMPVLKITLMIFGGFMLLSEFDYELPEDPL